MEQNYISDNNYTTNETTNWNKRLFMQLCLNFITEDTDAVQTHKGSHKIYRVIQF